MNRLLLVRWLLGYEGVPLLARPTFRYDFISSVLAALGSGPVVVELTQLFALKSLHGGAWVTAILLAEIAAGNLMGSFFSQLLHSRRRVPLAVMSRLITAGIMLLIALLPVGSMSLVPYVALLAVPAVLAGLIVNVQSGVWHANYPHSARGRIHSRLAIVRIVCVIVSLKLCSLALDNLPRASHLIYPIGAAFMLASALIYARIRVRGEDAMLRSKRPSPSFMAGARLLVQDKAYGRYMIWQMITGSALGMTAPVIVNCIKEMWNVDFSYGVLLLFLVPAIAEITSNPLAGLLFDRMNLMRYRMLNSIMWGSNRLAWFAALLLSSFGASLNCAQWLSPAIAILAGLFGGLASASGSVIWNIGHTRFAPPAQSHLYMGIHVTLTGVRGLVMPLLGTLLYSVIGVWVIALAGAVQMVMAVEFCLAQPTSMDALAQTASDEKA